MYSIVKHGNPHRSRPRGMSPLVVLAIVLIAVAAPRFAAIGGLPTTDEGFQAYYAFLINSSISSGNGLPSYGPIAIYPLIVSWIFSLNLNVLVALRLADLLFAVVASYIFVRIIEHEAGNRLASIAISTLFLVALNQVIFIQYGFKNSIYAAYLPLFFAFHLAQRTSESSPYTTWWLIGALILISTLIRETFLPYCLLAAFTILFTRGWRVLWHFTAGALFAAILILVPITLARGGIDKAVEAYRDASYVYQMLSDNKNAFFVNAANYAYRETIKPVLVAAMAALCTVICLLRSKATATSARQLLFWVLVSTLPLLEPATKIGFPYHFAVSLVGLAGLTAVGWRNFEGIATVLARRVILSVLCVVTFVYLVPSLQHAKQIFAHTRPVLAEFFSGNWPEYLTDRSNYLLAANEIRRIAKHGDTLAVSGFMYTLYPLTRTLPPSPELANLSATLFKHSMSRASLTRALVDCPPDIIMTTTRVDWPGRDEIDAAVRETGLYDELAEIPISNERSYGAFGGTIFRLKEPNGCGLAEASN